MFRIPDMINESRVLCFISKGGEEVSFFCLHQD